MLLTKLWEIISNPDWWIVLLTAINTTAVVFIAIVQIRLQKQQTKLQEQQNKQQEYEVYRALYVIIKDINRQAGNLPTRIYEYFAISTYNDIFPNGFWKFMYKEVNALSNDLDDRIADFELKFGDNDVDADDYYLLVCKMRMLLQFAERMEVYKYMACIEQQGNHPAGEAVEGNYSPLLDALAERTIYEPYKNAVRDEFERFINYRELVLNKKILDKIKERCKID